MKNKRSRKFTKSKKLKCYLLHKCDFPFDGEDIHSLKKSLEAWSVPFNTHQASLKESFVCFPCCVSFTSRTLLSVPSFSHSYCTLLPLVMYHISPDFPNPDLLVEKHLASQVLWVPTHMHESVEMLHRNSPLSGVQAIQLAKKCFAWVLLRQCNCTSFFWDARG